MYVLCALSRILSETSRSLPVRCATCYSSLNFQAHLQNCQNPDYSRLMDLVGLRIEEAEVCKVHFDKRYLEAHYRSCCCKEQGRLAEDLDHRHYGLDLLRIHTPAHGQNRHLFHGVDRHLYCLAKNGDGICRGRDLKESRPFGQGCHNCMGDVGSFL